MNPRRICSSVLDGDKIGHGLNASAAMRQDNYGGQFSQRFGLAFGAMDRQEGTRRNGAIAQLFCSVGLVTLTAFVGSNWRGGNAVRTPVVSQERADDFVEGFVNAPLGIPLSAIAWQDRSLLTVSDSKEYGSIGVQAVWPLF